MYDPLLREDSWVKEYVAEGKTEGRVEEIRQNIETIVQIRFPDLKELATECVEHMQDLAALRQVLTTLLSAQDERSGLRYLQSLQGNK